MSNQRGAIVAKNEFGSLQHLKGVSSYCYFIGTCVYGSSKRESTTRFRGAKDDVIDRWLKWQRLTIEQANEKERKKELAATSKEKVNTNNKKIVVLVFTSGRTKKIVGAFADSQKALDMASALETALEVSGADGEYNIEEIAIMG